MHHDNKVSLVKYQAEGMTFSHDTQAHLTLVNHEDKSKDTSATQDPSLFTYFSLICVSYCMLFYTKNYFM